VNFLPQRRRRRTFLVLASPLACGLAAVAVAFAAMWGMSRAASAVPVELPKVSAGTEKLEPGFGGHVITVRRDGGYLLGGSRLPRGELAARLERLGSGPALREHIVVRADAEAPFARIADLVEMCRKAGLGSLSFEVLEESLP
jgi:biopolymer transport protein ExbD